MADAVWGLAPLPGLVTAAVKLRPGSGHFDKGRVVSLFYSSLLTPHPSPIAVMPEAKSSAEEQIYFGPGQQLNSFSRDC